MEERSMQENWKKILFEFVPECVRYSLFYKNMNEGKLREIIDLAEDQHYIREMLSELGLCAFCGKWKYSSKRVGNFSKTDAWRGEIYFFEGAGSDFGITA